MGSRWPILRTCNFAVYYSYRHFKMVSTGNDGKIILFHILQCRLFYLRQKNVKVFQSKNTAEIRYPVNQSRKSLSGNNFSNVYITYQQRCTIHSMRAIERNADLDVKVN